MSEIIQFVTSDELAKALASVDQQVSGMSAAEAWNSLKLSQTAKMGANSYVSQGGSNVIDFPNAGASDAFNYYVEGGGATSAAGAAASGASKTFSIGSFLKAGVAKAGAILSLSLPQVFAAIAPLLGVGVGVGLYELSPEFWEKVSKTLLPFCWDNTENFPAVVSAEGQVYLDADAVEALKKLFDEEGLGVLKQISEIDEVVVASTTIKGPLYKFKIAAEYLGPYGNSYVSKEPTLPPIGYAYYEGEGPYPLYAEFRNNDVDPIQVDAIIAYDERTKNHFIYYSSLASFPPIAITGLDGKRRAVTISSPSSNIGSRSLTIDGKTAQVLSLGVRQSPGFNEYDVEWDLPYSANQTSQSTVLCWYTQYGDFTEHQYYPDGSSKYGGQTPVDYTEGAVDVIISPDGSTAPYYPVYIPVGDPGASDDPEKQDNPQAPNEFPDLIPWITPEVQPSQYPDSVPSPSPDEATNPLPSPAQNPQPDFNPDANPSVRPDPVPQPDPAPSYPEETPDDSPTSTGDSPPTIFPLPDVDWPSIIPTTGSGLVHVYNPTNNEMVAFGNWLWVTYGDSSIEKLWNNPFDGVISAHELYATPQTDGIDSIRSGFLVCPTTAKLVRVRYTTIDCGSMVIPEYFQNYLDYSPYSKAHVYLPFIGIVELNVDDIVGHAVNIKYHIDAYNGSCIAQITVAKTDYSNTVYQFSGNCAVEIPLAGGSQASIKAGMIMAASSGISSVVGGIASAIGGNIAGAVGSVVSGAGSVASHLVSQKSSVQHSGSFGSSYGAMGIKKPYIIIHRPIQKEVTNYNKEYGFPAHKMVTIGSCSGYLRVLEVHVKSPTATDEEKAMIETALKNGVFVN